MIDQSFKPMASRTVDELLARAAEYRSMAATATTGHTRDALIRLAKRFEDAASWRAKQSNLAASTTHISEAVPMRPSIRIRTDTSSSA